MGALSILFSSQFLIQRYSIGMLHEKYSLYTCVVASEFLKVALSALGMHWTHDENLKDLKGLVVGGLVMLPPAMLYLLQNSLGYVGALYIEPGINSLIQQLKLLFSVILSVVVLGRSYSSLRWRALLLLTLSAIVAIRSQEKGVFCDAMPAAPTQTLAEGESKSTAFGYFLALVSCVTSAFNGVYLERAFKHVDKRPATVFAKNFQLALYSLPLAVASGLIFDFQFVIVDYGWFHGFSKWALLAVLNGAVGGLLTGFVLKELDVVWKSMATVLNIVITITFTALVWGAQVSEVFLFGAVNIFIAIFIYNDDHPAPASSHKEEEAAALPSVSLTAISHDGASDPKEIERLLQSP